MRSGRFIVFGLLILLVPIFEALRAKDVPGLANPKKMAPQWSANGPTISLLNINNLHLRVQFSGVSPANLGPVGEYQGWASIIFAEGIVWGVKVDDGVLPRVRVGGNQYRSGLKAGKVLYDAAGMVVGSEDPTTRHVWRVRRDYQTADLYNDANSIGDIWPEVDIQAVYDQYEYDWQHWPAEEGAPFEDVDGNGVYDPAIDIPGEPGTAQTIWLVVNDLPFPDGTEPSMQFSFSPPIGTEMQLTLWAYDSPFASVMGNVVFKRVRLIYTGLSDTPAAAHIDTIYLSQWSDPDIGNYSDDFIGWDHDQGLGYAYNGQVEDDQYESFGLTPPALGYILLEGPIVEGDTLSVSSFVVVPPHADIADAPPADYSTTTLRWFNMMEGYLPEPHYPDQAPITSPSGDTTKFMLDGDPLTGTGWVDGTPLPPGDRQFWMSVGPFSMAVGDTQEIIVATVLGMGQDYLDSVVKLRAAADQLKLNTYFATNLRALAVRPEFASPANTILHLTAQTSQDVTTVIAGLRDTSGAEVVSIPLYDDGAHQDNAAGDFLYGNTAVVDPTPYPLILDLILGNDRQNYKLNDLLRASTDGPIVVDSLYVISDHLNADGILNPGENVRLALDITNRGQFAHSKLWANVRVQGPVESQSGGWLGLLDLQPGESSAAANTDWRSGSNFTVQVSAAVTAGDSLRATIQIGDSLKNAWEGTAALPIKSLEKERGELVLMQHVAGDAWGSFGYRIYYPDDLKTDHEYQLTVTGPDPPVRYFPLITLHDLTANVALLENHHFPDVYGHDIPITDGFKVLKGTAERYMMYQDQYAGTPWVELEYFYPGNSANWEELPSVELVFQREEDVASSGYAANGAVYWGTVYWDPNGWHYAGIGEMPFVAWELDAESRRVRQLNVSFSEREGTSSGYPPANMLWDMGWYGTADNKPDRQFARNGAGEYFVIHASSYNGGVDYSDENNAFMADVLWRVWPDSVGARSYLSSSFIISLLNMKPVTSADVYRFRPIWRGGPVPHEFVLRQNFPNPFNTTTRIDYGVHQPAHVKLSIYDLRGRQVTTLIDRDREPGRYSVVWNGVNQRGIQMASGIYLYYLVMRDLDGGLIRLEKSRKMILLK